MERVLRRSRWGVVGHAGANVRRFFFWKFVRFGLWFGLGNSTDKSIEQLTSCFRRGGSGPVKGSIPRVVQLIWKIISLSSPSTKRVDIELLGNQIFECASLAKASPRAETEIHQLARRKTQVVLVVLCFRVPPLVALADQQLKEPWLDKINWLFKK